MLQESRQHRNTDQESEKGWVVDQELKAKWLEALRSGEYVQGYGALCSRDNEYCCLGVLVEVGGLATKTPGANVYTFHWPVANDTSQGIIPSEDAEKIGLSEGVTTKLMELNDERRWSFEEIANWLEGHV